MKASVSQLARDSERELYIGKFEECRKAMLAFAGIRKDRNDLGDFAAYVRDLRRGNRLDMLSNERRF